MLTLKIYSIDVLELHKRKAALPPSSGRDKIEREIAVTDEKIDEIVYGLYEVTKEERERGGCLENRDRV